MGFNGFSRTGRGVAYIQAWITSLLSVCSIVISILAFHTTKTARKNALNRDLYKRYIENPIQPPLSRLQSFQQRIHDLQQWGIDPAEFQKTIEKLHEDFVKIVYGDLMHILKGIAQ